MRCANCDAKIVWDDEPCWRCGYPLKNNPKAKEREIIPQRRKDNLRGNLNQQPKDKQRGILDQEIPEINSSQGGGKALRIIVRTLLATGLGLAVATRLDARMPDELKLGVAGWAILMGLIVFALSMAQALSGESPITKTLDFIFQPLLGVCIGLFVGCFSKGILPGYIDFGVLGWAACFGMFSLIRELLFLRSAIRIVLSVLLGSFVLLVFVLPDLQDELHWQWATITHGYSGYLESWPQGKHAIEVNDLDDERSWSQTKGASTAEAYADYIRTQPQGKYLSQAREQMEEFRWLKAKTIDTVELYQEYMNFHSRGKYAAQAYKRIEELDWDKAKQTSTLASYREYINAHSSSRRANDAVKMINALITKQESVSHGVEPRMGGDVSARSGLTVVITPLRHPRLDVIYGAEARDQASGALLATAKQLAMEGSLLVVEETQYSRNGDEAYKGKLFFSSGNELVRQERIWGDKKWNIFHTWINDRY